MGNGLAADLSHHSLKSLDIPRKQCINLDYFVGAKRLGRQFDGKIRDMPIPNASP
jgi:hypothetical protein